MLDRERRRRYLSEAFHNLAQPITALHCGLEVALGKPRTSADYRKRIGDALEIASAFRDLTSALRELVDADDPGREEGPVGLPTLFVELQEALSPIASLHETVLEFESAAMVKVRIDRGRFLRAIALLVEQMLIRNGRLHFDSRQQPRAVEIIVSGPWQEQSNKTPRDVVVQVRIAAVENYIATLGGQLTVSSEGCRITLPVVEM